MRKHKKILTQNTGATTIIVVCVMAVIMVLSLGLFLTASVLMKTSSGTLAGEQCRIMAVSFSEEIERTLTDEEYQYNDRLEEDAGRAESLTSISLWHYVKQNISDGSWPYYDETQGSIHSRTNAMRRFQMEANGVTGEVADIILTMYWTCGEDRDRPEKLIVETTVTTKERSCSITDVYGLKINTTGEYERWSWKHEERH
mgnify:CR=1 FL=1